MFVKKENWKLWLLAAALIIVALSVYYANKLSRELAEEERRKIELWSSAYRQLNMANENTDIGFLLNIMENNTSVPVILVNEKDSIIFWRNLDSAKVAENPNYLAEKLAEMKADREPLAIDFVDDIQHFIYYSDSFPLVKLKYYPVVQLIVIGIFLLVAYAAFSNLRNAEQNRIWVGMAKETAHQLGTPISSLSAWVELLKGAPAVQQESIMEIEKDVVRLELIAERFSKIGSTPVLERHDISAVILKNIEYIQNRTSKNVQFNINVKSPMEVMINTPLFDWVMENLLKNALDAMEGKGSITVNTKQDEKHVYIDVKDTGKGIAKSKFQTVFEPGYSTKKRGWGLGLTLVKRIVENYHHGKVFVKESEIGKGTTFRIILNKAVA